MKQLYTTFVAVIAIVQFSYAQWTPSGSNIYYNSGNVGIGTTNPQTVLDVPNLVRIGSVAAASVVVPTTGASMEQYYDGTADIAHIQIFNRTSISWKPLYMDASSLILNSTSSGNVGIGTTSPGSKLQVNGPIALGTAPTLGSTLNSSLFLSNSTGLYGLVTGIDGVTGGTWLQAQRTDGTATAYNILLNPSGGSVAIGTSDPLGYKLAVNGSAIATSVTVKLYGNWPDYVFKKEYKLPSLLEVKDYIDQNHHLPDMPSEQEVKENGLNLGEINKILTKKVEELTLYLIDKDKQLTEQQKQINELKEQVNAIIQSKRQQ